MVTSQAPLGSSEAGHQGDIFGRASATIPESPSRVSFPPEKENLKTAYVIFSAWHLWHKLTGAGNMKTLHHMASTFVPDGRWKRASYVDGLYNGMETYGTILNPSCVWTPLLLGNMAEAWMGLLSHAPPQRCPGTRIGIWHICWVPALPSILCPPTPGTTLSPNLFSPLVGDGTLRRCFATDHIEMAGIYGWKQPFMYE